MLVRFGWLGPAISLPLCIALASLGIQAAAFRRPPRDDLLAAKVVHTLLGYHLMRATEEVAHHPSSSICLQGWFPERGHRHLVRGELVLLGSGVRLYDLGSGVRRFGRRGGVSDLDRIRFLLAGCPRFIGEQIGRRLVRSLHVDVDRARADDLAARAIVFGRRSAPIDLFVTRHAYTPIWLALTGGPVRGTSDLEPGGSPALATKVRRAFDLERRSVRRA